MHSTGCRVVNGSSGAIIRRREKCLTSLMRGTIWFFRDGEECTFSSSPETRQQIMQRRRLIIIFHRNRNGSAFCDVLNFISADGANLCFTFHRKKLCVFLLLSASTFVGRLMCVSDVLRTAELVWRGEIMLIWEDERASYVWDGENGKQKPWEAVKVLATAERTGMYSSCVVHDDFLVYLVGEVFWVSGWWNLCRTYDKKLEFACDACCLRNFWILKNC